MIPSVIHYCWFGRNPLPPLAKKCIRSWKKHCKGYKIIEWNEDNFDLASAPLYVRQAYEAKKWAFVTDYVRLKVVYDHGGIYLDTDVEVLRSLDDLLQYNAFFGFDNESYVATGLGFGAVAGADILDEIMRDYRDIPFISEDGTYDLTGCPRRNTEAFLRKGLVHKDATQLLADGTIVFASDYFCPKAGTSGDITVTANTYTIHHFVASWYDAKKKLAIQKAEQDKKRLRRKNTIKHIVRAPARALFRLLGEENYNRLKRIAGKK